MKLNELKINDSAIINKVNVQGNIKKRLYDLGLVKKIKITKILENKSMVAYNIKGAIIAIRKEDTKNIEVIKCI